MHRGLTPKRFSRKPSPNRASQPARYTGRRVAHPTHGFWIVGDSDSRQAPTITIETHDDERVVVERQIDHRILKDAHTRIAVRSNRGLQLTVLAFEPLKTTRGRPYSTSTLASTRSTVRVMTQTPRLPPQ